MISVIIPCYNCAPFIKRAIKSVIDQTYQQLEIILVDNNSTDETLAILQEYQDLFPEKIRVEQEHRPGAPAARNNGLAAAKGEWIQFLDADDELLPQKLEKQLNMAIKNNSDLVVGNCVIELTEHEKIVRKIRYIDKHLNPWRGLVTSTLGITSSILWRREKIIDAGGWNEEMSSSQEYDLLFRMLIAESKVTFDHSLLTVVHKMNDSISKSTDDEKFSRILQNRINLRLEIKDYLKKTNRLTSTIRKAADLYIYNELNTNYWRNPRFVKACFNKNRLDIPLTKLLKTRAKLALQEYFDIKV